jgi:hypothetical protein
MGHQVTPSSKFRRWLWELTLPPLSERLLVRQGFAGTAVAD